MRPGISQKKSGPEPAASPGPLLRPPRRLDAEDVAGAFASNPDMARQGSITSTAEADGYVQSLLDPDNHQLPWGIEFAGRLAGLVCITVDWQNLNGWFWYWMADQSRGRGWAKRAAATVAGWALTDTGLFRLELGHRANNPASAQVAKAAGFLREGTERAKFRIGDERVDVHVYSRLRTDPCPNFEPLPMRSDPM